MMRRSTSEPGAAEVLRWGGIPGAILFLALTTAPRGEARSAFSFFQPIEPARPFQVMAHRGMKQQAPENTAAALRRCIEDGIEWAEVDVRLTRDHQHVLVHDDRLERTTNGTGFVRHHTLAELLALDAGAWFSPRARGERLLTLPQALALAKGKLNLYLDCKNVDPELLVREVLNAGMQRQVVVFADLKVLQRVRAASGGQVAVMARWRPAFGLTSWVDDAHLDAVEISAGELTPEVARAFHDRGIVVQARVLGQGDTPAVWDRVIAAGADWLQSDLPEDIIARELWKRKAHHPVRIAFHRGANRYAPENTLPAFEEAIQLGADYVEFDVRTTSDGRCYLLHDGTLDRTTSGKGPIRDAPAATVAGLDAGAWFGRPFAGVHPPSLEGFLTATEGKVDLYFDAKDIAPETLARGLAQHGMVERTVVYQSADFLRRLAAIDPRIRGLPPLRNAADLDALATELHPYGVDASWEILSRELIDRCHALGIRVFSDALGNHETIENYRQAIGWGIDVIQTDHPLRVMRAAELGPETAQ